ncbi:hypothetical protein [Pararobbsia silviterrae]|uniref:Uncharacterized protein n=1 Tax=Pararobbsia silviterrae TaxID=1792498 RepID=A0A494X060_9BURK|nr:hypothetical protein [Pararobbsia silviterrae]RKP44087.1 hypothetical protein D7S86_28130 [Pararobbsia silviterrae]
MNVATRLKAFTKTVVIVDDNYKDPNLDSIEDTEWAELRAVSTDDWTSVAGLQFPGMTSPRELRKNKNDLARAWGLYKNDTAEFAVLDPIFAHLFNQYQAELKQLIPLTNFLKNDAQLELRCHPNLQAASDDIRRCKLIFLDFFIEQTSPDDVIANLKEFGDLLERDVQEQGNAEGRFVYLMSSNLPLDKMEQFRRTTKLKSAFFRFVQKRDLSADWLQRDLGSKLELYKDMRGLSKYLDTFQSQIRRASESIRDEISSIELHDLTLLHSLRLEQESEGLGEYLNWLFSEALAAKIRGELALHSAARGVSDIEVLPFNGDVQPNSGLLDLYADVTFATRNRAEKNPELRFGDVIAERSDTALAFNYPRPFDRRSNTIRKFGATRRPLRRHLSTKILARIDSANHLGERLATSSNYRRRGRNHSTRFAQDGLLLVISPACDLQRCSPDYQVMLVRGDIVVRSPNLNDLLTAKAFAGGFHLLREKIGRDVTYLLVKWDSSRTVMISAHELSDRSAYFVRGRLNELLCHEMKEAALRHLGRVGVPVDPSFSVALAGKIKLKVGANSSQTFEIPDTFIAGIRVEGNKNNLHRYVLSRSLGEWLRGELEQFKNDDGVLLPKLQKILQFLDGVSVAQCSFDDTKNGVMVAENSLKIRFVKRIDEETTFKMENELLLYPRKSA